MNHMSGLESPDVFGRELSKPLRARLDAIIATSQSFWEQPAYIHFTSHGPAQSERVHRQKLAQLAQELPEGQRLTPDEIFIVSAAAYLYEIGMKSPNLRPHLDFDYQPGDSLTMSQLQAIRNKKHLLSEQLIQDSLQGKPIPLGLTPPGDGYDRIIAQVCRWCSDEPLDKVPLTVPVNGLPVRVRLLVALLRLADQLYIDSSRVNLDLLQRANLPMKQQAKWWMYHYTQVLPIANGQIPFYYFLPVTQKEYIGHIRGLIEPDFEFDNNPNIQYLWQEHKLRLIPHRSPTIQYDQPAGFQREMSREITVFLRQEVKPIATREPSLQRQDEPEDRSLLVVDYENLLLQLGQEGYFLTKEDTSRLVVDLLREARDRYDGPVDALAVGQWSRPDLADVAQMLEERVYDLVEVNNDDHFVNRLSHELGQRLQTLEASGRPKRLILVAPHQKIATTVRDFTDKKHPVVAWISNLPEADIFRAVVQDFKPLSQLLDLTGQTTGTDFEFCETACILRLDAKLFGNDNGILLAEIEPLLVSVEQISAHTDWWQLWLFSQQILIPTNAADMFVLNTEHSSVVNTHHKRDVIIKTLQTLSQAGQNVKQEVLLNSVKNVSEFRDADAVLDFLDLLKREGIVFRDARSDQTEGQPSWQLNSSHWAVVSLNPDRYLPLLILAIDHFLVYRKLPAIHEHSIVRQVAPYVGESVAEVVYKLALEDGLLSRQVSNQKRRHGDGNLVYVSLIESNLKVGNTLRNRDIIVSLLSKKNAADGLAKDALWHQLSNIKSFKLKRSEYDRWLSLLQRDSVVKIIHDPVNNKPDCIQLDFDLPLTRLLCGRMNVYSLIRNLRIMRATSPAHKRPSGELVDRLARFVTYGNKQEAGWILDYAKSIKLVDIEKKDTQNGKIDHVFLKYHSFVRQLDQREESVCQALAELVKSKQRGADGWVPRYIIVSEMEEDPQFGFSRGEHDYWLDQAIHRLRCINEKKERDNSGRLQIYVQAK
jgi:hypothetical protein